MNQFAFAIRGTKLKSSKLDDFYSIYHNDNWELYVENENYNEFNVGRARCISFGDIVNIHEIVKKDHLLIQHLKGHFYLFVIQGWEIQLYSSFLNILPIYYKIDPVVISNSIDIVESLLNDKKNIDKTYLLETLLFNYGFSNKSIYQEIKVLASNSYIKFDGDHIKIEKHTKIFNYYVDKPMPVKKSNELKEYFINNCKDYFPKEPFSITFTSGFDSRTLIACAISNKSNFVTCSFGKRGNDDVIIPQKNAKELSLPYTFIDLQDPIYIDRYFKEHAEKVICSNPGFNGYLYPHFSYLAYRLSKNYNYLVTGYFGSEIFRALHVAGTMTSNELVQIFLTENKDKIWQIIYGSPRLAILPKSVYKNELEELFENVMQYRNNLPRELSQNQKYYLFIFEEVFRKVFGAIIKAQMDYLTIRTPYLDFEFITALLKTGYAGANNDFFSNNPLKRYKGQLLYAEIIKKTSQKIYYQQTGKGYRPCDLLQPLGKFKIVYPFLKKRLIRRVNKNDIDNLGIISGIIKNKAYFEELMHEINWLNTSILLNRIHCILPNMKIYERDNLLQALSLAFYLKGKI